MTSFVRIIAPALFALTVTASLAHAQSTTPPAQAPATPAPAVPSANRPTAETIQRLQDGRIAMAKAALKMTDAQLKLWTPVEDAVRAQQAERAKGMADRAQKGAAGTAKPSLADRLESGSARMAQRAEQSKAFAAVFRPFFESLTDSQKAVAGPVLAELNGHKHGHGHSQRWAAHNSKSSQQ